MKKIIYLAAMVGMLAATAVVMPSCMKEWEEQGSGQPLEPQLSVAEARSFFERYAAEADVNLNPKGMAPGNFAPQWDKAVANTLAKRAYADVPIVAERTHTAYFAKENAAATRLNTAYYITAVAQRLVVGKNTETGEVDCAIATIIPAAENATRSHERVQKMFAHNRTNAGFSGVVAYSSVATNSTLAVSRYVSGKVVAYESAFNDGKTDEENVAGMAALVRQVIVKGTRTVKSTDWTIELPEIEISGGSSGGVGGYPGSVSGGSGNNNPGNPPDNNNGDVNGGELPTIVVPGYGGGGGGGGGGGIIWTPPYIPPYAPPKSPNASKIFNNNNSMSNAEWAKVEDMIRKIMNDCAGKTLYNMLSGNSINLVYDPYLNRYGEYDPNSNTLKIKSLENFDDVLYHEMLHFYQHRYTTAGTYERALNREVEAWVLQYIYASKQVRYMTSKRLQKMFENDGLGLEIQFLLFNLQPDNNPYLTNSQHQAEFLYNYGEIASKLRNKNETYNKKPFDSNYAQSRMNILDILRDC